jgi:hypothetical protein
LGSAFIGGPPAVGRGEKPVSGCRLITSVLYFEQVVRHNSGEGRCEEGCERRYG